MKIALARTDFEILEQYHNHFKNPAEEALMDYSFVEWLANLFTVQVIILSILYMCQDLFFARDPLCDRFYDMYLNYLLLSIH